MIIVTERTRIWQLNRNGRYLCFGWYNSFGLCEGTVESYILIAEPKLFKLIPYVFNDKISNCAPTATTCRRGPVTGVPVKTVAKDGNC